MPCSHGAWPSWLLLVVLPAVGGSRCNGKQPPGAPNLHPIDTDPPQFVREVPNGKLYAVGQGDDRKDLVHVWGSAYDNGQAMAQLLGPRKLATFVRQIFTYTEGQIISNVANQTWCSEHRIACAALREVMKLGLTAALDLSYRVTAPYIKPYVMEELRGIANASGGLVSLTDLRNVNWLGEVTRGSCSMFGAKDSATQSRGGNLLQLRALDWDVDGPFKNWPVLVVYHPMEGHGHAWANLAFAGFTASVTGFSAAQLGLSEIGVSFPDPSFGPERYFAKGYPFGYLIRDVLQFDTSLAEATRRITEATRTCDLILGVGDGHANDFSGFQYSPHVAQVIKPSNLLPANDTWHAPIRDVVYWGMDWICPNDNKMLGDALRRLHGNITAEATIRDITSYVSTGNLHIAVYDHAAMHMYVATARLDGRKGPLYAFQRQFVRLDMRSLFDEPPPAGPLPTSKQAA